MKLLQYPRRVRGQAAVWRVMGVLAFGAAGIVAPGISSSASHAQAIYTYTTLNPPGSNSSVASAINDSGEVVGTYQNSSTVLGFLYKGGTYTTLNPGGALSGRLGINASGEVVGTYYNGSTYLGFLYNGNTYKTNFPFGLVNTSASAINDSGEAVVAGPRSNLGFISNGRSYTTLSVPGAVYTFPIGINASGEVVGSYNDGSTEVGFLPPLCRLVRLASDPIPAALTAAMDIPQQRTPHTRRPT
jgi:uncharacterized membrane protein